MKKQAGRPTVNRLWAAAGPGLAALLVMLGAYLKDTPEARREGLQPRSRSWRPSLNMAIIVSLFYAESRRDQPAEWPSALHQRSAPM